MAESRGSQADRTLRPAGRPLHGWLRDYGVVGLLGFGIVLLALGLFIADDAALQTALAVMGAAAAILAFLLPQLEGEFQVGPHGVRGKLVAFSSQEVVQEVERAASQRGLEKEQLQAVLQQVRADWPADFKVAFESRPDVSPPDWKVLHDFQDYLLSAVAERYVPRKKFVVGIRGDRLDRALETLNRAGIPTIGPARAGWGEDPASWTVSDEMSAVVDAPDPQSAEAKVKDNLPKDGDYTILPATPLGTPGDASS